jgi:hypothetical protein
MLSLLLFAEITANTVVSRPSVQARAAVRIERPAKAGAAHWKDVPPAQKRQIDRRGTDGRTERLRIIDYP